MRRFTVALGVFVLAAGVAAGADEAKKYGFLGVSLGRVSKPLAAQLGLEKGEGVLVVGVADDSPAAKAGLAENDVIVRVDDQVVLAEEQFRKLIGHSEPGMVVTLHVIRKGKRQELTAKLGETDNAPTTPADSRPSQRVFGPDDRPVFPLVRPPAADDPDAKVRPFAFNVPGRVFGKFRFRGPDGKQQVLEFGGDENVEQQLKELHKKGLIDEQTLDKMYRWIKLTAEARAMEQAMDAVRRKAEPARGLAVTKKKLAKAISFDFVETPLNDVLAFLRGLLGVNLVLDPAVAADRKAPPVTLRVQDMPAHNALDWIAKTTDREWAIVHGVVCFGDAAFIQRCKTAEPLRTDDAKMSAALAKPLSFDFQNTPLTDATAFLQGLLKINMVVLPLDDRQKETVTLTLDTTPASAVLPFIGLMTGRPVTLEKQAVRFGRPGDANAAADDDGADADAGAKALTVWILRDGGYRIGDRAVAEATLRKELAERVAKTPGLAVVLRADPRTEYRHVAHALALSRKAGVRNVRFATKPAGR
jgi:biopolymer transport protein ExbD/membrane-associated protease RseP (regulator of RpoE activity)